MIYNSASVNETYTNSTRGTNMYHKFNHYKDVMEFIRTFNSEQPENAPSAKLVAWPHDSNFKESEWIVFTPKKV